jgi:lipoyl(octanoyl) transferase
MAVDAVLLQAVSTDESAPVLRFYGWDPPALSLGRNQSSEGIHFEALMDRGWPAVRRPTGGRAVLHQHELTFALVLPLEIVGHAGVLESHCRITHALRAGLRRLPLARPLEVGHERAGREPNCFQHAAAADITADGGKLVGSAQARTRHALLQHGSLLLDVDHAAWMDVFGTPASVTTLRELTPSVSLEEVRHAITQGIAEAFACTFQPDELTTTEEALAAEAVGTHQYRIADTAHGVTPSR